MDDRGVEAHGSGIPGFIWLVYQPTHGVEACTAILASTGSEGRMRLFSTVCVTTDQGGTNYTATVTMYRPYSTVSAECQDQAVVVKWAVATAESNTRDALLTLEDPL